TALRPENPPQPPMLCMLLRKHMQGGKILSVTQPGGERIMMISFTSTDELGRVSEKKLVCELMGKRTNILLLDEEGIILGCVRKVDYEMSPDRAILPGLVYRLPGGSGKTSIYALDRDSIAMLLKGVQEGDDIMDRFEGVSPQVARELVHRGLDEGGMADVLYDLAQGGGKPWLVKRKGADFDFSALDISYHQDGESILQEDFSSLMDSFYMARREEDLKKNLSSSLKKTLENHRARLERKLGKQRQELLTAQKREDLKQRADLITSNIYAIRSGDSKAVVTDYFTEGMPTVEIPLDPELSPQQNAQLLYKRYTRLKNAEEALMVQIEHGESELEYLESLLYQLEQARGEKEIRELSLEASQAGYVKKAQNGKKNKPEKQGAIVPKKYVTAGGFTLLRGRNNRENDHLTMRMAKGGDLWFHARNIPGSHVIMVLEGREPSVPDIEEAAALAAFWSKAGKSPRVPVDYTRAKHVKKPSGARPGMVNYFEFKTILIEPSDKEEI
ncbi:MAG: NFACT family protein, partial [Clostridia bacterium]|nr:NFACT family protein [Clostridia bacterium]